MTCAPSEMLQTAVQSETLGAFDLLCSYLCEKEKCLYFDSNVKENAVMPKTVIKAILLIIGE